MQHFWADSEYLGKINTKKNFQSIFFQCLALPQSFGSQNLRCPFSVSQYYRLRRLCPIVNIKQIFTHTNAIFFHLNFCQSRKIAFVYPSSTCIQGDTSCCKDTLWCNCCAKENKLHKRQWRNKMIAKLRIFTNSAKSNQGVDQLGLLKLL